jgi:hypothetical protein
MKPLLQFAGASAAIIAVAALVLALVFSGPDEPRAVWTSAVFALVVQVGSFILARRLGRRQMMLGWGAAAGLRFVSLVVYAVVVAKVVGLPIAPALIGLATFFFLTSLIEPLFLRT